MKLTPKTELELKTVFTASCVESVANAMYKVGRTDRWTNEKKPFAEHLRVRH